MLFDLHGKRRRVVQVTYLGLAVVMGGGLVLLGVGSDTSGGLLDAFSGGGGGGSGNQVVEDRIDDNEKRLEMSNPAAAEGRIRKQLVRDYYSLASGQTGDGEAISDEARADFQEAAANWQAYLDLDPERPDTSLAGLVLQLYDPNVLNKPQEAKQAAQLIARVDEDANAYLNLIQYAVLAQDTRTADLAAQRAIDLAPKAQKAQVREQAEQLKMPPQAQGAAPSGGAAPPAAPKWSLLPVPTRLAAPGRAWLRPRCSPMLWHWLRSRACQPRPVTRQSGPVLLVGTTSGPLARARAAVQYPRAGEADQRNRRERVNFTISDEEIDGQTHLIELGGEIDLYTAPEFKERMVELIEAGKEHIVVDLSQATFIDSTTLGVLVGGVKRLRPSGGALALVCTDQNITKIFEITGLDRVFAIHGSRDEAIASLSSPAE
jgi:anti-sigma B factor antagonist